MDIVYDSLFKVEFYINPTKSNKRVILDKWTESEDFESDVSLEENDELDLLFSSSDENARLYFEALECCPRDDSRIKVDEEGFVYCTPSDKVLPLYRSNNFYDALRVDCIPIIVNCDNKKFFSKVNIIPKHLSDDEWRIMRDDIEKEMQGLSQDIVRRNIGLGGENSGHIPPASLYSFLIIEKYSKAVLAALLDIKDKPYYKIINRYVDEEETKAKTIDKETVKQYLKKTSQNNTLFVPKKEIVYDIQENRLLKKILKLYDNKLDEFIEIVLKTKKYYAQESDKREYNKVYATKFIENLENYLETAKKLKKTSNILKNQEWFKDIHDVRDSSIPHSFAMDSRYGTLYRMYSDFKRESLEISFDAKYAYSWKKSSSLYEIWCYLKLCRALMDDYNIIGGPFKNIFIDNNLIPFLESGTTTTMENDTTIIEIIYDYIFPKSSRVAKAKNIPVYFTGVTGRHFRPDICINVYSKESKCYIGSVVVECKYRNLRAFWSGDTWSSKEQIIAYVNDSKSEVLFGGGIEWLRMSRPVNGVFVFTPDENTNVNSIEARDNNIFFTTFKPSVDESIEKAALSGVKNQIIALIENYKKFINLINH